MIAFETKIKFSFHFQKIIFFGIMTFRSAG